MRLKELILENQTVFGYEIIEMEVMPDHVHLLISVNPYYGVHPVITRIKGLTSNILRKEFPVLKRKLPTLWTRTKFISTVGSVSLETVKKYIEEQKGK
jgi:putative transposase